MASFSRRALLVNTFGMFGYLFCLFLWMWVVILYLPLLFDNDQFMDFLVPTSQESVVPAPSIPPSPALIIFGFSITFIVIVVTIFILLRAPVTIAKTGRSITAKTVDTIEPIITHGKVLPPKEKRRLTVRLIKFVKLLLAVVPLIAGFLTVFISLALPYDLVMLVTSVLAAMVVFWFSAQYIFAKILGVKPEKLV